MVLGLRDVLDAPEVVAREWRDAGNESAIERSFDSVWIYGDRRVVDPAREYGFGAAVREKIEFMGYLDRRSVEWDSTTGAAGESGAGAPYALCLVGGGEDGHRLAEAFVALPAVEGLRRVCVLGPFLPDARRAELRRLALDRPDLELVDFTSEPLELIRRAACVISMGGHNSVSEILSFSRPALIVPRVVPRREQWIRAHRLAALGLVDVCDPEDLSTSRLADWIEKARVREPVAAGRVDMGGLERVRRRVEAIAGRRRPPIAGVDR